MFISKTAVRSLSSLLVVAVAATTSVVGGATTTNNRKLSKNSPPPPLMTECPSRMLYYPTTFDGTIGSQHILQVFRAPFAFANQTRLCQPGDVLCIGDSVATSNTLYSDKGLTNKVGRWVGTTTIVSIEKDYGAGGSVTGSVLYDTGSAINVAGFQTESFDDQDLSVSGGTG